MIDPATGWFELHITDGKSAMEVANLVDPWLQEIVYDRGSEFMGDFAAMIADDYGITKRPIIVRNSQANSIIEKIHQTLGNIIQTFELHNDTDVTHDSWKGVLSAAMFALRATYHTTLQAMPMQLVRFIADRTYLKQNKEKLI